MPSESNKKLTIKFDARGDKTLIAAINKLANSQQKLTGRTVKANAANKKYRQRVNSNTKAIGAQNAMMTKAQGVIAQYRNRMLLAAFAITFVQKALVGFVKMAGVQESSVRRLADVFGGEAARALDEYSSVLQQSTMYGDELTNNVMAQIGAFGANAKEVKTLTKAAMDLAAGLGLDLNTAGLLIAKTFGSSTNALIRYGVSVDATASKSEKQAAIIDAVNAKWGGLAEKLAQTTEGQLAQASNAWGDFAEQLGKALIPIVLAGAKALKAFAEAFDSKRIKILATTIITLYTVHKILNSRLLMTNRLFRIMFVRIGRIKKAYKATVIATQAFAASQGMATSATGIFSGALRLLKLAFLKLRIEMAKNPIAAIALALTALAVGVAVAMGAFSDGEEDLDEFGRTAKQAAEEEANLNKAMEASEKALSTKLELLGVTNEALRYRIEQDRDLTMEEYRLIEAISAKNAALKEEKDGLDLISNIIKRNVSAKENLKKEKEAAEASKKITLKKIADAEKAIADGADKELLHTINKNQRIIEVTENSLNSRANKIRMINKNIADLEKENEEKNFDGKRNAKIKAYKEEISDIQTQDGITMGMLESTVRKSQNIIKKAEGTTTFADILKVGKGELSETNEAIGFVEDKIKKINKATKDSSVKDQFESWRVSMALAVSEVKATESANDGATSSSIRLAVATEKIAQINKLLYKTDLDGNVIGNEYNRTLKDKEDMIISVADATIMLNNATAEQNAATVTSIKLSKDLTKHQQATQKGVLALAGAFNTMGTDSVGGFADSFTQAYDGIKSELSETMSESEAGAEALKGAWEQVGMEMASMAIGALQKHYEAKMQLQLEQGKAQVEDLKSSKRYQKMSAKQKKQAEDVIAKETNKKVQEQFKIQQQLNYAAVIMDTGMAIMKAMATIPPPANIPIAVMTGVMGAVQLAEIAKQKPPKMAQGGLIKGLPHNQGGQLINAEGGEYVMNKKAVETTGIETMNKINMGQGLSAPVSVVFSGNINSDEFIELEAIPKIKEAIRRGADIGVE